MSQNEERGLTFFILFFKLCLQSYPSVSCDFVQYLMQGIFCDREPIVASICCLEPTLHVSRPVQEVPSLKRNGTTCLLKLQLSYEIKCPHLPREKRTGPMRLEVWHLHVDDRSDGTVTAS
jgi:hypothetical protein